MSSMASFFERLKPAMDTFLKIPTQENLEKLESEIYVFNWLELKIVHVHILLPLVVKLEELNGKDQEMRTGILNCIRLVISNLYIKDVNSLGTILTINIKQLRNFETTATLPDLSEEIKLAVVLCITEAFKRTTTDALEQFYTKKAATLLGHILLMLVELVEKERYRKLKGLAAECLMTVFYAHDNADVNDVVLRSQVADTMFIYLPKIISVLYKISTADDKYGERLKTVCIKSLGRILNIIYEDTNDYERKRSYSSAEFKKLIEISKPQNREGLDPCVLDNGKIPKAELEAHFNRLQLSGRSSQWFRESSIRIAGTLKKLSQICSVNSKLVRHEYAIMCTKLLLNCAENLKENYIILLQNIIALSQDEEEEIRTLCTTTIKSLRDNSLRQSTFDESADVLFEENIAQLLQVLHRKDEYQLFTILQFLKGLLKNVGVKKLYALFSLHTFKENFCLALITAVDLVATHELLNEEYALRLLNELDYLEYAKLQWRNFKFLETERCVNAVKEICELLGNARNVNSLLFDYLNELFQSQQNRMDEILIIMIWMFSNTKRVQNDEHFTVNFAHMIIERILNDVYWHLALQPDAVSHLKVHKPSYWFVDRTPGLYESGIEVRVQDYDSDDEQTEDHEEHVTIADAQQNILHTCLVLDALGNFANFLGPRFKRHVFQSLHKVLLKVANSNTMIYKAAMFSLISMQRALGFQDIAAFIESETDYISYHLTMLLRRSPESSAAVDILSVVLQLSTRSTLPYLENIFLTIREECSKSQQEKNIYAYLRVFNSFLINVDRWQSISKMDVERNLPNEESIDEKNDNIILNWIDKLVTPQPTLESKMNMANSAAEDDSKHNENPAENEENGIKTESCDKVPSVELPRHIEMVKAIVEEALKFITSTNQSHQIQALECLITGMPLLNDYENELLPMVHTVWHPLMQKFKLKDPLVLNRCFSLLDVLSTCAKDFILKRSLDEVIPYLQRFLKDSAKQSAVEHTKAQTQIYKLQYKLLEEFSNLIKSMQIDGRHLNDIGEVISLYLSDKQPFRFQTQAVQFFLDLHSFNGPMIYLIAMKKSHLKEYKQNVSKILKQFNG